MKWAFGFPGATAVYGQTVYDGRLYVTSNAGYVYSLNAETGCVHWGFRAQSAVRSGFIVGSYEPHVGPTRLFFGDIHGVAYALDASTGEVLWKTLTDPHPLARITGTPVLHEGRLYVPVTSLEEPESGQADYACCTFRGFMAALDAATGRQIWKTYIIPELPRVVGRNSRGKDMLAPAGAGIWVTPTLDVKRRALYFGTGNAFSGTPSTANAVMALNMDTGKVLWSMQALPFDVWHNGCPQNIPGRAAGAGRGGARGTAPERNCGTEGPVRKVLRDLGRPQSGPPPVVAEAVADVAAASRIRRRTVPRSSDRTGISRRPRRWRRRPTVGTSSSHRKSRVSSGRSIPTPARCSGSRTSPGRSPAVVARRSFGGAVDGEKGVLRTHQQQLTSLWISKTGEEVWYSPLVPPQGRENLTRASSAPSR